MRLLTTKGRCLIFQQLTPYLNMKSKLRLIGMILFTLAFFAQDSFGQFSACKNNNDDPPPYAAPGRAIESKSGLPVYIEIDAATFDNNADNDFCIGNSGADETDDGCGTFIFKNLIGGQLGCATEFCFKPKQGCGNAEGNACYWQEDPNNPGSWQNLGSGEGNLCFLAPAGVSEYAVTICRPGKGPVSIVDVMINEPPVIEIANQSICVDDLATAVNLASLEPAGFTGGTWKDGTGNTISSTVNLTGTVGDVINYTYCYDATAMQGYDCIVCTDITYSITNQCCTKTNADCPDFCDNTLIYSCLLYTSPSPRDRG